MRISKNVVDVGKIWTNRTLRGRVSLVESVEESKELCSDHSRLRALTVRTEDLLTEWNVLFLHDVSTIDGVLESSGTFELAVVTRTSSSLEDWHEEFVSTFDRLHQRVVGDEDLFSLTNGCPCSNDHDVTIEVMKSIGNALVIEDGGEEEESIGSLLRWMNRGVIFAIRREREASNRSA